MKLYQEFLGRMAATFKINAQKLILQTRLQEASRREEEVQQKNRQLKQEATERERAEEALRKAQEELEIKIKERTRDLEKVNKQLIISLHNKETLLKEVYHRAKNNLQIVLGLIRHQRRLSEGEQTVQLLKHTENRILSIALIHDQLYKSKDLSRVKADTYIRSLVNDIYNSTGGNHPGASLDMDLEDIFLSVEAAVPFGLILNELVSNSLEHAFPKGRKGKVTVIFREINPSESERRSAEKEYELIVMDNGIGLPANLDINTSNSLGFQLVAGLVLNQLKGDIKIKRTGGTEFVIRFKDSKYTERI